MKFKFTLTLFLFLTVMACTPTAEPEEAFVEQVPTANLVPTRTPSPLPQPTFTPTAALLSITPTPAATPTQMTMSADVEDWSLYQNDEYGYLFSYPPNVKLTTVEVEDDSAAEPITRLHLSYGLGYITISTPPDAGVDYHRGFGIGNYDLVEEIETVALRDQLVQAEGYKVYQGDGAQNYHSEFFVITLENGMRIYYGVSTRENARTDPESAEYFEAKEITRQLLKSFQFEDASVIPAVTPIPSASTTLRNCRSCLATSF